MSGASTALTTTTQHDTPAPFEPGDLPQAWQLAQQLAQASLLPGHLRGKPADVMVTLLLGRDLGLTAMQAITGIHVIEGKPSVSSQTAVALVKRSPLCRSFACVSSTDEEATYETHRAGEARPQRLTYSMRDASRAGLAGKSVWKAHPSAMLRARAAMALCRDVYPDVVANLYDPDEAEEIRDRDRERTPPPTAVHHAPAAPPVVAAPAAPSAPPAPTGATPAEASATVQPPAQEEQPTVPPPDDDPPRAVDRAVAEWAQAMRERGRRGKAGTLATLAIIAAGLARAADRGEVTDEERAYARRLYLDWRGAVEHDREPTIPMPGGPA